MSLIYLFPGQGSQKIGMGAGLFERFPELTAQADQQLAYSIEELCLKDPHARLGQTQFTQPALFVINAFTYLAKVEDKGRTPDYLAGHSLGEYNALFASGVFDFLTGLKLVQKRGELMSAVQGGGMAAVVGLKSARVSEIISNSAFAQVDVANYNSPQQTVISGPARDVADLAAILKEAGATVVPLKVSGAFHSRMMRPVQEQFEKFLEVIPFQPLAIPVIANCLAQPYRNQNGKETLARQITSPVRWTESIEYLLRQPAPQFEEAGPGMVLTNLLRQIKAGEAGAQ